MRITASRKDDILKRKAEYDARYNEYKEARQKADQAYNYAIDRESADVENRLYPILSKYKSLPLSVDVNSYGRYGEGDSAEITIKCEDSVHTDPLSWTYNAYIRNGEVQRETSSWSGMNAVTPEDIDYLEECVKLLRELTTVDWAAVLSVDRPKYQDYYGDVPKQPESENFTQELIEAELEEIVGDDSKAVKCSYQDDRGRWRDGYALIQSITPKFYNIYIAPRDLDVLKSSKNRNWVYYTKRSKDKVQFKYPLEIFDV